VRETDTTTSPGDDLIVFVEHRYDGLTVSNLASYIQIKEIPCLNIDNLY
jgi:hypothetical protein